MSVLYLFSPVFTVNLQTPFIHYRFDLSYNKLQLVFNGGGNIFMFAHITCIQKPFHLFLTVHVRGSECMASYAILDFSCDIAEFRQWCGENNNCKCMRCNHCN